ncbi:hypothetical protein [Stenotrophomonas sp. CFBP 13725]|uniref:hypothetical protein n=1 Tax=Stenotrophomonas sp. CFBP 13725 TaxID=2775297 RepID=UPI0017853AA5|nr:hypothetical protein [Stenotrophomonas sp. CFBP 13725]MBD8637244.1 hypothetical protein [Stenotrophomonas sp. CFBP 13725]
MQLKMGIAYLMLSVASYVAYGREVGSSLIAELEAMEQPGDGQDGWDRIALMRSHYEADERVRKSAIGCRTLAKEHRQVVFNATSKMDAYERDPVLLRRMRCLLRQMQRDGSASRRNHLQMHAAFVSRGRFNEANRLRIAKEMSVPLLPGIRGAKRHTRQVLWLDEEGHADRVTLPMSGWRIIALVHPYCSYWRKALVDIADSRALVGMQGYVQLVVPSGGVLPQHEISSWNRAHRDMPLHSLQYSTLWAPLNLLQTPVFHLMHNGVRVDTSVGWTGTGEELLRLYRQIPRSVEGARQ